MPLEVSFTCFGTPVPQGSTRAFIPKGWSRPIITAANSKTKPWRQEIAGACIAAIGNCEAAGSAVPIRIEVQFFFDKPKSTKKSVTDKVTKPDLDKLVRSCLDALTGIAFDDDSQVTEIIASKGFGSPARMEVKISEANMPPRGKQSIVSSEQLNNLPF